MPDTVQQPEDRLAGHGRSIDRLRREIAETPMSRYQILVVAMCVAINVLDGFDILAMAFAAPAISREWQLAAPQTGTLLSAGLLGIGAGALVFSAAADIYGRRPVILFGTVLIAAGMLAASFANSMAVLAACRVLTGLGIGGMTSTAGTLAIEYSPAKRRTLSVALVVIGYPFGATVGGLIAVWLLGAFGWRSIFLAGAIATAALLPLLWWRMPESVAFLAERRPRNARVRINRFAARMGRAPVGLLPPKQIRSGTGFGRLFVDRLGYATILLCLTYALFMFSFYFIISWATSLVTMMGLSDTASVATTALINGGGVVGGFLTGLISARFALTRLVFVITMIMAAAIAAFGLIPSTVTIIALGSVVLGFFMWSSSALMYSMIALSYPVVLRATGIGLVITAGRAGSVLGPYTGGVLLGAGFSIPLVTTVMAVPAAFAAALALGTRPDQD